MSVMIFVPTAAQQPSMHYLSRTQLLRNYIYRSSSNQLSKKYSSRVILRYNHADWDKAQDLLDVVDWDSLLLSSDVNQAWLFWKEKFLVSS